MKMKKLNLANPADYENIISNFGGREYLQKNFPRILEMLEKSKEEALAGNMTADEVIDGYQNAYRITTYPMYQYEQNGLFVESMMSMVNQYPMIMMTSKTWDPHSGKVFASFSEYGRDEYKIKKDVQVDHSYLNYTDKLSVTTETTFYAIANSNGKCVLANDPVVCTKTINISNTKPIVSNINVIEPREKKQADAIRVVYNNRSDPEAAYSFSSVKDEISGGVRYVEVYYPFSVEITLSDEGRTFTFDKNKPVSLDEMLMTIASEVVKGGEVHFNTANLDKVKYYLLNDYTLRVEFAYDSNSTYNSWGVQMPLTDKQAEGSFNFHLNFPINFFCSEIKMTTDIIITSESLPKSDQMVKIKYSNILWGCIGENAEIRTQNGDKKIQDLKIGDMIYTEQGYKRLVNIVMGSEAEMISISVDGHETLLLTPTHAIVAERGVIDARSVVPNDRIRLIDKSYVAISKLEKIPYNGKVYSLELEQSEMIFANGIMVGDYKIVAGTSCEVDKSVYLSIDKDLQDELIRWAEEHSNN